MLKIKLLLLPEVLLARIDVLVNNAGIAGINKPTDEATEEEWDKVITVNVRRNALCKR